MKATFKQFTRYTSKNNAMTTKLVILCFFTFLFSVTGNSQINSTTKPAKGRVLHTVLYKGDTIPYARLPIVICSTDRVFKNARKKAAWERLKYNVKKVYPYAILAAAKLKEYDRVLATMKNERDRTAYMKATEAKLKAEFSDDLKNLSMSQGKILVKLIDRETGKTTYDVVKNMRGSFSATMWQGVALCFNSNLKADYDAEGDERGIEMAIKMIEDGQL